VDGKFLGPGGVVPASQAICSSLLEECFDITQEIKAQEESKHVATSLKPIYDRLSGLRAELENLVLTHRWSLRETDLWNYSLSLQEIDKMRIDGKFVDSEGNRPSGQYVSQCARGLSRTSTQFAFDRCYSTFSDDVTASYIDCCHRVSPCRRS
jgi:hypothetical protein